MNLHSSYSRKEGGKRNRSRSTRKQRGGIFGFHDRNYTDEEIKEYENKIIELEAEQRSLKFLVPKLENTFKITKKKKEKIIREWKIVVAKNPDRYEKGLLPKIANETKIIENELLLFQAK